MTSPGELKERIRRAVEQALIGSDMVDGDVERITFGTADSRAVADEVLSAVVTPELERLRRKAAEAGERATEEFGARQEALADLAAATATPSADVRAELLRLINERGVDDLDAEELADDVTQLLRPDGPGCWAEDAAALTNESSISTNESSISPPVSVPATPAQMVREFHEAFGLPINDTTRTLNRLRADLIREEAREAADAIEDGTPEQWAQELADLAIVVYGAALTLGIDLDRAVSLVHAPNMTKLGLDGKPVMRADGKVLKGPGYVAPDMAAALRAPSSADRLSVVAHPELDFPDCLTDFARGEVFAYGRAIEECEGWAQDLDRAYAAPYRDVARWLEGRVEWFRERAAQAQAPSCTVCGEPGWNNTDRCNLHAPIKGNVEVRRGPAAASADTTPDRDEECGALEGMTGIECNRYPGHQDWHSGKHTPRTDGAEPVGYPVRIQWPRQEWDRCAPASNTFREGDSEPRSDVRAVRGGRSGRTYVRRSENYGGPWDYDKGADRDWLVWQAILREERSVVVFPNAEQEPKQ